MAFSVIRLQVFRDLCGVEAKRAATNICAARITIRNARGITIRIAKDGKMVDVDPSGLLAGTKMLHIESRTEDHGVTTITGELGGNYRAESPSACEFRIGIQNGTIVTVKAEFPGLIYRYVGTTESLVDFAHMLEQYCAMTFAEFNALVNP